MAKKEKIFRIIRHNIIVSCQAEPDEPLGRPEIIAALAESAVSGGATAIRANLPENIKAIRSRLSVPLIGLLKKSYPGSEVFITPTHQEIRAIADTGIEILAMDATLRPRPGGERLEELVGFARKHYDLLLMADISTLDEGLNAERLGFDLIGTTLSGYTTYTESSAAPDRPDLALVRALDPHGPVPLYSSRSPLRHPMATGLSRQGCGWSASRDTTARSRGRWAGGVIPGCAGPSFRSTGRPSARAGPRVRYSRGRGAECPARRGG